jgi:hypothetical protein
MSMVDFDFHNIMPGQSNAQVNEVVARGSITWGPQKFQYFYPAIIDGATRDAGNTGFTEVLRPGLLLGFNNTTKKWGVFDPAATDGTQMPAGVLLFATRMTISGVSSDRFTGQVLIRGMIRAGGLSVAGSSTQGIVGNASEWLIRSALSRSFVFDDRPQGYAPEMTFLDMTAATLTLTELMAGTMVITGGATNKTITLPATPKRGLTYSVFNKGAGTVQLTCATADIITTLNDETADTVTLSTASNIIGGGWTVLGDGARWLAIPRVHSGQVVTVTT